MITRKRGMLAMIRGEDEPRLPRPRDLDLRQNAQVGDELAEEMRRAAEGKPSQHRDYGPPEVRMAALLRNQDHALRDQMTAVIDQVTKVVLDEIAAMRKELDELQDATMASSTSSKATMENHLVMAAQAMLSCQRLRDQVSEFRKTISDALPQKGLVAQQPPDQEG